MDWTGWGLGAWPRNGMAGAAALAAGATLAPFAVSDLAAWQHALAPAACSAIAVGLALLLAKHEPVPAAAASGVQPRGHDTEALRPGPPAGSRLLLDAVAILRPQADAAMGFAEILADERRDLREAERRAYLDEITDSCRRMSAVLRQIAEAARLDHGILELLSQHIDAADLAEIAIRRCSEAAEAADVTLLADLTEGIEIDCDAARLRQALEALTHDVIARAAGGCVRFVLRREASDALGFTMIGPPGTAEPPGPDAAGAYGLHHLPLDRLSVPVACRIAMLHGGGVTFAPDGAPETVLVLPASRVTWPRDRAGTDTRTA